MLVHGKQGEPSIISLGYGSAWSMFVHITDFEILKIAAECLAIAVLARLYGTVSHASVSSWKYTIFSILLAQKLLVNVVYGVGWMFRYKDAKRR
tara:strand:- start:379 stop:660 length:282 start_codon:yes stop_codon:yes gene_type:complete